MSCRTRLEISQNAIVQLFAPMGSGNDTFQYFLPEFKMYGPSTLSIVPNSRRIQIASPQIELWLLGMTALDG
jgi:hypothetical protein